MFSVINVYFRYMFGTSKQFLQSKQSVIIITRIVGNTFALNLQEQDWVERVE